MLLLKIQTVLRNQQVILDFSAQILSTIHVTFSLTKMTFKPKVLK